MKIPAGIDIYIRSRKLKPGSECPKQLEKQLQKAIDARNAQAKKLGERLAPYQGEETVIEACSPYPEFRREVMKIYSEAQKSVPKPKNGKVEKDS